MKKIYSLITVGLMIATAIFSMTTVSAEWEPSPPYQPMPMIKNVNKDDWHGRPTVPGDKNIYFTATVDYMEGPFHWIYEFTFVEGQQGAPDNPIFVESDNDLEYNRMNPTWFFTYGFNFVSTYTVKIKVYNDTGKQASWPQLIPADNYTYIDLNVNANSEDRNYAGVSSCSYDELGYLPFEPEENKVPVHLKGSGAYYELYQGYGFTEKIYWKLFEGGAYHEEDWEYDAEYDVAMTDKDDDTFDITLKYKVIWGDPERDEYWEDEDTIENGVLIYSNWFWLELDVYNWIGKRTWWTWEDAWFTGHMQVHNSLYRPGDPLPPFQPTPELRIDIRVYEIISEDPLIEEPDPDSLIKPGFDIFGRKGPGFDYEWRVLLFNLYPYDTPDEGDFKVRMQSFFRVNEPAFTDIIIEAEPYNFTVIGA